MAIFTEELNNRDKKIETLEQKVTRLQQNLGRLEEKLDESDAYERRDTIIFSGNGVPAAKTVEIVSDVVCAIVKDELKIKMSPSDISTSHRLGNRPKTQGPDMRNIIVKLCRREHKHELISASKQVRPENIYLSENLTPTRNHLLFVLAYSGEQKEVPKCDCRLFIHGWKGLHLDKASESQLSLCKKHETIH